jgi:hypothetical protein
MSAASAYIADLIRQRTLVLRVLTGLSPAKARQRAVAEIAHEQRRNHSPSSNSHDGSKLYRRLAQIVSNMHGSRRVQEPLPNRAIDGELARPVPNIVNLTAEPPPNKPHSDDVPCGVWSGTSDGSSAELIDDAEFGPRWRDITTAAWKGSIAHNERVERERAAAWEKRLAELRGRT